MQPCSELGHDLLRTRTSLIEVTLHAANVVFV